MHEPLIAGQSGSQSAITEPGPSRGTGMNKRSAREPSSQLRRCVFWGLSATYIWLILGLPALIVVSLFDVLAGWVQPSVAAFIALPAALVMFPVVAGILSLPHQRWIRPGRWPTDVGVRPYFHRRLYGVCWTSLYYNQPVYWAVLTIPLLRRIVFRLFGYRGTMRFTVYPDTWIRDLPLLKIGEGAYLSNKCTIGTNMILPSKEIVVDSVEVGAGATIGHLAAIGPGASIGDRVDTGVGAMVGMNARLGHGAVAAPGAIVNHLARVGDGARLAVGAVVDVAGCVEAKAVLQAGQAVRTRTTLTADGTVESGRRGGREVSAATAHAVAAEQPTSTSL